MKKSRKVKKELQERKINFEAVEDLVVVLEEEHPEKTESGLYYPSSKARHKRRSIGLVVSVGPKVEEIKEGDTILIGRYSGSYMEAQGVEYVAVRESEILGTVEGNTMAIEVGDTQGYMQDIID